MPEPTVEELLARRRKRWTGTEEDIVFVDEPGTARPIDPTHPELPSADTKDPDPVQ